jgi:hypothetical protein
VLDLDDIPTRQAVASVLDAIKAELNRDLRPVRSAIFGFVTGMAVLPPQQHTADRAQIEGVPGRLQIAVELDPHGQHGAKRGEVHVKPLDVDLDDLVSDVAEFADVQPVALLPADCFHPQREVVDRVIDRADA